MSKYQINCAWCASEAELERKAGLVRWQACPALAMILRLMGKVVSHGICQRHQAEVIATVATCTITA